MNRRVLGFVAMALLSVAGGCVSETSFRDVMQQLQQALSKNEQLQSQVTGLNAQITRLGQEKAALQTEVKTQQAKVDELASKLDAQAVQIKSLSGRPAATTRVVTKFKEPEMGWAAMLAAGVSRLFAEEIRRGTVGVKQQPDRLVISLADQLLFDDDDFKVSVDGEAVLGRHGKLLATVRGREVVVGSHLDSTPIAPALAREFPTAWDFTGARAVEVLRFFQEESKLDATKLSAAAYGSFRPVSTNATEAGRAMNRRIEVTLFP